MRDGSRWVCPHCGSLVTASSMGRWLAMGGLAAVEVTQVQATVELWRECGLRVGDREVYELHFPLSGRCG